MASIRGFKNSTQQAINSLESDIATCLKLLERELLDLNREDQLFEGKGSDGKLIGRYSQATEDITRGMQGIGFPKNYGRPFNFYNTGGLFKGFSYRFSNGDKLQIINTDYKIGMLEARYGKTIIGLTPDNQHKLNYELILPLLRGFIKRHYKA